MMYYCFCPDGHQSSCTPSYVLPAATGGQLQEPPYMNNSPALLNESDDGCCKGTWIFVCYQHTVDHAAYALNHHPYPPLPHVLHLRPSPPPSPSATPPSQAHQQLSTGKPHDQLVVTDNQKNLLKKPFTDDKPTVRVYCKAQTHFSLTIRHGKVVIAPANPNDLYQHWIKDEKFGKKVKDEHGHSSFALVNKATGQAIKHSIGVKYPVQLTKYNPDKLDKTVLWSMGKNFGYRSVRAVDNFHLNLDAHDDDAKQIVLWDWKDGDNQKWTIVGY